MLIMVVLDSTYRSSRESATLSLLTGGLTECSAMRWSLASLRSVGRMRKSSLTQSAAHRYPTPDISNTTQLTSSIRYFYIQGSSQVKNKAKSKLGLGRVCVCIKGCCLVLWMGGNNVAILFHPLHALTWSRGHSLCVASHMYHFYSSFREIPRDALDVWRIENQLDLIHSSEDWTGTG